MQSESFTPLSQFLQQHGYQCYLTLLQNYGLKYGEDISFLTPEDWKSLSNILPFHRSKLIYAAGLLERNKIKILHNKKIENIHKYQFSSNGPYSAAHLPENLKNFEPEGYGLQSTNDCFMKFTFGQPLKIYGMIIGNNIGVSGGWNNSYLEGVQIQVKIEGTGNYETVHTIQGMPNTAKTAYLAKIEKNNVKQVKLWKASYFSTSFIHFV